MKYILVTLYILILSYIVFNVEVSIAGEIVRDPAQVRSFKRANPCPATGQVQKTCPGYVVDHIIPLCANGADHPSNMQWQDKKAGLQKDKLEWWTCRQLKQCRK